MSVERKAWECPKCGRVLAPHVDECPHCVPGAGQPAVKKTGPWLSPYEWPSWTSQPFYYYSKTTVPETRNE